MFTDVEGKRRNVIPRWRDFKTTLALGELRSTTRTPTGDISSGGSLEEQLSDWQRNRTLAFATDLVGAGFVLGKKEEVQEAAEFILSMDSSATDLQKRIARQVRDSSFCEYPIDTHELTTGSSDELISESQERVRRLRARIRKSYRDPIRLVELSREYAILGSQEKALRTMEVALALAPSNRFVLRSAVRLFVHTEQFERAHYVLKKAPSLRRDPWLLSAEIAVSSLVDRTSSHIRTGKAQLSDGNHSAFEVSELASAIATLEMNNANSKLARKLFRQALQNPTENSIAQAEWASRAMPNLPVEVRNFDTPRKYEALAWSHFKDEQWNAATGEGKHWILDQPFAISPVIFTGFVSSIIEDFELSKQVYSFGLAANPENAILRNNLAFALASNDEPDLAAMELDRVDKAAVTIQERIVMTATEGLIHFRKGRIAQGRESYRRAITLAEENKEPGYAIRALVYLAREEIYARTVFAKATLENAEMEFEKFSSTELHILLQKLKAKIEGGMDSLGPLPKEVKGVPLRALSSRKSSE